MDIWEKLYQEARRVQGNRVISPFIEAGGVAAALLTKAGNIYVGVCIDTASTLGMCAERNAIANMLTNGESRIDKLLAVMPNGTIGAPCGACREYMMQLDKDSGDIEILMDYSSRKAVTLKELIPAWWGEDRFAASEESQWNIRLEQEEDYREVENLTREAFWNVYRPGCTEHLVLHNLRKEACFVPELDYVIEDDGKIIAHIAYAKGSLKTEDGRTETSLLFGPVSVLPEYQGRGYGSKLIQFTLEKARELGYPAVVITGNPAYYSRFGFEPAAKHGIYLQGMDKSQEAPFFLGKILDEKAAKDVCGIHVDPACYEVDHRALEEFDRSFPPKVKEVRLGQLE